MRTIIHDIDCFDKVDLAYRNTIVDRLCVVRKFDEHHVLLDNINGCKLENFLLEISIVFIQPPPICLIYYHN